MNPAELATKTSALNGQLDAMKTAIEDRFLGMTEQLRGMIASIQLQLYNYIAKGTQWVSQHVNEIRMKIQPEIEKVKKNLKKAQEWMQKQLAAATKYIQDRIDEITGFANAQIKAVEDFVQEQLEKQSEKMAELQLKKESE